MPDLRDDPLYHDLHEGFLTEGSNGGEAVFQILGTFIWWALLLITWPIRIIVRRTRA